MKLHNFFTCFVVCLIMFSFCVSTGCTSSNNSQTTTTQSATPTAVASLIQSTPVQTVTPSLVTSNTSSTSTTVPITVTTNTTSTQTVSTIATPVFQSTKQAADDPWVENFHMDKYSYGISDCIMQQAFPDIAKDPDYGIKSAHPKLVGISNEKWNSFYQDWITGKNTGQITFSVSKCQNVPYSESTTWDFASVTARITPRNARPTNYMVIVSLSAYQKNVAQLITNETLTIDQPITIQSWIPIKRTEIGALDNPKLNFNKLSTV
jgi:hypothetical protein